MAVGEGVVTVPRVGDNVGANVGSRVDSPVGADVASVTTGDDVGGNVGDAVGPSVGSTGAIVGGNVGEDVGSNVVEHFGFYDGRLVRFHFFKCNSFHVVESSIFAWTQGSAFWCTVYCARHQCQSDYRDGLQ
mmetsp:Transcript_5795/g.12022  ORF Transcript_5795/g.12022 Transcript_5795/m.12022 type:complete len:132 (-) Transcript_5795:139-534(-)